MGSDAMVHSGISKLSTMPAMGQTEKSGRSTGRSALPPIVLKNSFWGDERNFLELLIRIERGDVRDHIDLSKIDHGPW
jgi:hypothetical protein